MSVVITRDGTEIDFKNCGPKEAKPVVFSHGLPLSADSFEDQMFCLVQRGYRCIAHAGH